MGEESSVRSSSSRRGIGGLGRSLRRSKNEGGAAGGEKKKRFKRLRGLLTGESRRERKARKAAARRARGLPEDPSRVGTSVADDASTIYGVDVQSLAPTADERRTAAPSSSVLDVAAAAGANDNDAGFEALQVILLLMDPATRRFELLQLEFDSNKAVVGDVLAQVPHSVTEEALRKKKYVAICNRNGKKMVAKDRLSELCKSGAEIFIGLPDGVSEAECSRLARPILSDDKVLYMLKSTGIDITGLKESKETAKPPALSSKANPQSPATPEPAAEGASAAAREAASAQSRAINASKSSVQPPKRSTLSRLFVSVVLVVVLAAGLQLLHLFLIAPLEPGQSLMPGAWKVKCGLLTLLPSCENGALEMNFKGELAYYGPDHTKEWVMQGGICSDDESCVRGLEVQADGSIVIGGKKVTTITAYGKPPELAPWPFEKAPKLGVIKRTKEN